MFIRTAFLAAAAVVALSASAFAVPIAASSQFNISGFNIGLGGASIDTATGLDFTGSSFVPSPGVAGVVDSAVGSGIGSFAGLTCNSNCGTIKDIPAFIGFAPLTNFYNTTVGVSFDLNTLSVTSRIPATANSLATLIISGTGTFHYSTFDATPGVFTLTSQGGNITTFSASTIAQTVAAPEPASMAILGAGLAGLGLLRRRRQG